PPPAAGARGPAEVAAAAPPPPAGAANLPSLRLGAVRAGGGGTASAPASSVTRASRAAASPRHAAGARGPAEVAAAAPPPPAGRSESPLEPGAGASLPAPRTHSIRARSLPAKTRCGAGGRRGYRVGSRVLGHARLASRGVPPACRRRARTCGGRRRGTPAARRPQRISPRTRRGEGLPPPRPPPPPRAPAPGAGALRSARPARGEDPAP